MEKGDASRRALPGGQAPGQEGHCVAQGLSREIFTPSKGAQRTERTVSLCWKLSAGSPPPPKASRLAEGNACLGGEAAGVGEDGRQAPENKHMCSCTDKY